MKVLWEAETDERGTPIEKANAIIKSIMPARDDCDEYLLDQAILELAEIRDLIGVYVRYRNNERRQ